MLWLRLRFAGEGRVRVEADAAAGAAEDARRNQKVIGEAVTPEGMHPLAHVVVPARVGQVFVEFDRTEPTKFGRSGEAGVKFGSGMNLLSRASLRREAIGRDDISFPLNSNCARLAGAVFPAGSKMLTPVALKSPPLGRRRHTHQNRTAMLRRVPW